ncbi:hypothetical protein B484DRAFT_439677, partial [Ochromonadaceae sp. CCMP2298]
MEARGPTVAKRRAAWHRGDRATDLWREEHMHTAQYQQWENMWGKDLASLSWQTAAHLQANHVYLLRGMLASAGPDICFRELHRSVQESRYRDFRQAGGVSSTAQGAEAGGYSSFYNPDPPDRDGTQWGVNGPGQVSDFEDQLTALDGTLRDDSEDSGSGTPIPAGHVEELDILATEIRSGEDPYEGVEDRGRVLHSQHQGPPGPLARESPVPPIPTRDTVRLLRQRAAEALRAAEQAEAAMDMEQVQAEQSTLQEQYVDSVRHEDRVHSGPSQSSTHSGNTPSSYDIEEHGNYYSSTGSDDNDSLYSWEAVPSSAQLTGVEPAMVPQAGPGRVDVGPSTRIPYGVGCGDRDTPVSILHTPSVTPDREAPVGGQSEDSRRTATLASVSTRPQETPDRFFRLPNAVEAEFMANNPEEVELMWQEDIVQLPQA